MYMFVQTQTTDLLHLKRSPGIRSWSLLVGFLSVGLAAAYYSSDSLWWKSFYVTGCLFVALQNMEEWEDALFDKTRNVVELKTFSLYALVLTLMRKGQDQVILDMQHLHDLSVRQESVRYLGKGYVLMLHLETGFSYPLTQNAILSAKSDVEAVAGLLRRFLGLEEGSRGDPFHGNEQEEPEAEAQSDLTDSSGSED
ncbi:cytochrome b-245 chaperone 1 homolog [Engraulis encrasicolus]|uniref:cytochrome b-245 chaperone 1 homolog n=1 Tax=Engraulis encrasicolus TaxID=184585 RepID=UPI002FCFC0B3